MRDTAAGRARSRSALAAGLNSMVLPPAMLCTSALPKPGAARKRGERPVSRPASSIRMVRAAVERGHAPAARAREPREAARQPVGVPDVVLVGEGVPVGADRGIAGEARGSWRRSRARGPVADLDPARRLRGAEGREDRRASRRSSRRRWPPAASCGGSAPRSRRAARAGSARRRGSPSGWRRCRASRPARIRLPVRVCVPRLAGFRQKPRAVHPRPAAPRPASCRMRRLRPPAAGNQGARTPTGEPAPCPCPASPSAPSSRTRAPTCSNGSPSTGCSGSSASSSPTTARPTAAARSSPRSTRPALVRHLPFPDRPGGRPQLPAYAAILAGTAARPTGSPSSTPTSSCVPAAGPRRRAAGAPRRGSAPIRGVGAVAVNWALYGSSGGSRPGRGR